MHCPGSAASATWRRSLSPLGSPRACARTSRGARGDVRGGGRPALGSQDGRPHQQGASRARRWRPLRELATTTAEVS